MNPLQKIAHARNALLDRSLLNPAIKFAQIGARAEASCNAAVDDDGAQALLRVLHRLRELLELFKRRCANLVARIAMQFELDDIFFGRPRKRLAGKIFHCARFRYISSISERKCAAMASRLSLPLAVSIPLSMVNGSSAR